MTSFPEDFPEAAPADLPGGDSLSDMPEPGEQSELDLGVIATGDARVDAALTGLTGLSDRPIGEHPAVFEQVHDELAQAMSEFAGESDVQPESRATDD